MKYSYTARNKVGEKMSGTIDATDKSDAMRKLERTGLIPVFLNAGDPPPSSDTTSIRLLPRKKIAQAAGILALVLVILYFASPYWSLYNMRRAMLNNDAVYVSDHVDFPKLRESLKATLKTQMAKEVAKGDADGFEVFGAALGAMMIEPMVDALVTPEGLIGMMQGKGLDELEVSFSHVDFPKLRESLKDTFKTQMAKEVAKGDADRFEVFGAALGAMMIGPVVDALVTPEGLIGMMQSNGLDELEVSSTTVGTKPQQRETKNSEEMNVSSMRYEKLNRFIVEIEGPPEDSSGEEFLTMVFQRTGLFSWQLTGIRPN